MDPILDATFMYMIVVLILSFWLENNSHYFFLSAWAGKMNQILQSDWFRERAEFSDLDRGQRNVNNKKFVMGF